MSEWEWLNRYPPEERLKHVLTEWCKKYFLYAQLNGIDSSISGGGVREGEIRISFNFCKAKALGELIFGIREEDLIGLEFEPKEGMGFVTSFLEEGKRIRIYDDEIIHPFNEVIKGQKIETINFRHLDEERSRFSLWLSDGARIHINALREPKGRVMIREAGVFKEPELLLSQDSGSYLVSSKGLSEG